MLVTPTTQQTPAGDVYEIREHAIMMARAQISSLYDIPSDGSYKSTPPFAPWLQMAHFLLSACVPYGVILNEDRRSAGGGRRATPLVIKQLNGYLRQTLIQCAVEHQVMIRATSESRVKPWVPLLYLARDRAIAELDKSNIDPRLVARLRPSLVARYGDLRDLVKREDGTMPPAVHPDL